MFTKRLYKAIVVVTLAIVASIVTLSLVPMSKPAIIPVTGNQNAYSEFLRSEKAYYSNAPVSNEAFSAWHIGEKVIAYYNPVEVTLWKYRLGEKNIR